MLSVPFEVRLLLARDPRALTAVGRIFVQEIFRWQRERAGGAKALGLGELTRLPTKREKRAPRRTSDDGALPVPSKADRRGRHSRGFDVHAGVVVSASDRGGRERLLLLRPPAPEPRTPQRSARRTGRVRRPQALGQRNPSGHAAHPVSRL